MHTPARVHAVGHILAQPQLRDRIEAVIGAGVALDLGRRALRHAREFVARRGGGPVVRLANQHQQFRAGLEAALQIGFAPRVERDRERRRHRRLRHVGMARVERREHGAAAIGPAHQTDAARVDIGPLREPVDRRERIEPPVRLGDGARADALRAELLLAARRERVQHQRVHAVVVEQARVLQRALAERALPVVGSTAAVQEHDGGRRRGRGGAEPETDQRDRPARDLVQAGQRDAHLRVRR